MGRTEGESPPLVYRTLSSLLAGAAGLVLAAWFLIDSVGALDRHNARAGAAATVFAAVLVFAVTLRPAVIADGRRVLIRNPFRSISVPWSRVHGFGVRYSLDVRTADATFAAWAVSRSTWRRARPAGAVGGTGARGGTGAAGGTSAAGVPGISTLGSGSLADEAVQELTDRLESYRQGAGRSSTAGHAHGQDQRNHETQNDQIAVVWSKPMLIAVTVATVLLILALVVP